MSKYKFLASLMSVFMAASPLQAGETIYSKDPKNGIYRYYSKPDKYAKEVFVDFSDTDKPDGWLDLHCKTHISKPREELPEIEYSDCKAFYGRPINLDKLETVSKIVPGVKVKFIARDSREGLKLQQKFDNLFLSGAITDLSSFKY